MIHAEAGLFSYDELIKIWQAARYDNNVEDLFGVSSLGQA